MDHQLIAAVEYENDRLQEPTPSVEAEPQLTRGTVLIEIFDPYRPCRCMNRVLTENTVLQRRAVNIHAANR